MDEPTEESSATDLKTRNDLSAAMLLGAPLPELQDAAKLPAESCSLSAEEFESLDWSLIPRLREQWHAVVKQSRSYSRIPRDEPRYIIFWECCLAEGPGKKVCLGFNLRMGYSVAAKVQSSERSAQEHWQEIESLRKALKGSYALLKYEDALDLEDGRLALVSECVDNVLAGLLPVWKEEFFGTEKHIFWIQHIGLQVLDAALDLSRIEVDKQLASGHCDVCPKRILIDALGFAKLKGVGVGLRRGLRDCSFEPPEVYEDSSILPCNLYSCSKRLSFSVGKSLQAMMLCSEDVLHQTALPQAESPHYWHLLRDLINSMTCPKPSERLDLILAKKHPFFCTAEKCVAFLADAAIMEDSATWTSKASRKSSKKF